MGEEEEEVYEILWTELLTIENQPISDFHDITVGMKVMTPWICDDGKTNMAEATIFSLEEGGRLSCLWGTPQSKFYPA